MADQSKAGPLSRYFHLERFGTTVGTEVLAGLSTYLGVAYIFIVNPAILSKAGIDPGAALFATAVAACLSTLAMGLWANLPFAVAPGLTMNSYFVFVVCAKLHFSWQQALATVLMSGVVCIILTWLPVRQWIIDSIPTGLKRAIAATVGVFVATIGLFLAKLAVFGSSGLIDLSAITLSTLTAPPAIVLAAGLLISAILGLKRLNFPAGMLIAIVVGALLCVHFSIAAGPSAGFSGNPMSSAGKLDLSIILEPRFWLPVLVFFVLDFFEGIGEFIGMTANTTIQDQDGNVPNLKEGLYIDGMGTVLGSVLGTSSLIIFVESAIGIKAGGRTGLVAVTCAALMAISALVGYFFAPTLALIPAEAAAGVLVYVGWLLLSGSVASRNAANLGATDIVISIVMSLIAFATFGLDKALAVGFWGYFVLSLIGDSKPKYWLAVIASTLTAEILWQRFGS